jgi:hypothetical protein
MNIVTDEHGDHIEVDQPALFGMIRGGKKVAEVVSLTSGKCIVSWPTSTIVYDSEMHARAVHIDHMKGRGEPTEFRLAWATKGFMRGFLVCYQDRCEGCHEASGPTPPSYIPAHEMADYERGYRSCCMSLWGADWKPNAEVTR